MDARGLPRTVLVEARSLFEAAAEGFEKLHREGGCRFDPLEVTVHEPRGTFQVQPGQLLPWLGQRTNGETRPVKLVPGLPLSSTCVIPVGHIGSLGTIAGWAADGEAEQWPAA
jgi:hypothetical protein